MANSIGPTIDRVCTRCSVRQGLKKKGVDENECALCKGIFLGVDEIGQKIIGTIKSLGGDIRTFAVGTRMPKDIESFEERLWENIDITKAQCIKGELNREVGKYVEKNSKFSFSTDPDIRLTIDPIGRNIEHRLSNTYFYGRYNKLKRFVRQTKKKETAEESVEAFIETPLLKLTGGRKATLHGAGREDIDALMVGSGRPFVIEVVEPKFRRLSAKKVEREINKSANGAIRISGLKESNNGPIPPNLENLNAVLFDLHRRFNVHPTRVYFSGFSGGSRMATWAAINHQDACAGIICIGGGVYEGHPPKFHPMFFIVGESDYNHDEVIELHRNVERSIRKTELIVHPGGHTWGRPEDHEAAIRWLDGLTKKKGRSRKKAPRS